MLDNYNKKLETFQKFINNRYFKVNFDETKIFLIDANTNEIILIGTYEILGYKDEENKKWLFADENKLIEKNLTKISSEIKKNSKISYDNLLEELKKTIDKNDSIKWLVENKKKYVSNNNNYTIIEYVIITEYLQIK